MKKGTLIIFEGIDGSGKSTQYKTICEKLDTVGREYTKIVFPRYDRDSSALIRMYLNGYFGQSPNDVNAYTASLFYAVDRFSSFRDTWGDMYSKGGLIIADRYTTSNIVHQGAKLPDKELPFFFDWIADLEYNKIGLPEPDQVFYLDVNVETSLKRMAVRRETNHSVADIHEKDVMYLKRCLFVADKACTHFGWKRIAGIQNGQERSMQNINDEIFSSLMSLL